MHAGYSVHLVSENCFVSSCVCVCVCVRAHVHLHLRLIVTSGVIWTPYDWINKFYSYNMAAIVGIASRSDLRIDVCCRNQPNKSKLVLYQGFF